MTAVQKTLCQGCLVPRNLGFPLWQRKAAPVFKGQRQKCLHVRVPKTRGFPHAPQRINWEVAYPVSFQILLGPQAFESFAACCQGED